MVTSKSEQRNISGVLERATCNMHGIYTDESYAEGIALKYGGSVSSAYLDDEHAKYALESFSFQR